MTLPSADAVLNQLEVAYPNIPLERSRSTFRKIYGLTISMLHNAADKKQSYSAFEEIDVMRDAILNSGN